MIIALDELSNTTVNYLPKLKSSHYFIYLFIILGIIITMASLPFLYTDVTIRSTGITRPVNERTDVKVIQNGVIDSLFYSEGGTIHASEVILRLKDNVTPSKTMLNQFEITQRKQFIHDLDIITTSSGHSILQASLVSPLYKEQYSRFIHQKTDQEASLRKANKELEMNTSLINDKVISKKEFFDTQINQEKIQSAYKAFIQEQLSNWQQDLAKYKLELSQYEQQGSQITTDASYFEVKAPITGTIQNINNHYAGGYLQSGETICSISPSGSVIAECYVPAADIGLVRLKQNTKFQIDAFDYNYFGVVNGKVQSIDNDYSVVDNKPVFKVRCTFDSTKLYLKNGYTGELKKGLTFQCRFMIARRSLWELLWDKMDNWLNPSSPLKP